MSSWSLIVLCIHNWLDLSTTNLNETANIAEQILLLFLHPSAKYLFLHWQFVNLVSNGLCLICCRQCIPLLVNSSPILAALWCQALLPCSYNLKWIYLSNFKTKQNLLCLSDLKCQSWIAAEWMMGFIDNQNCWKRNQKKTCSFILSKHLQEKLNPSGKTSQDIQHITKCGNRLKLIQSLVKKKDRKLSETERRNRSKDPDVRRLCVS